MLLCYLHEIFFCQQMENVLFDQLPDFRNMKSENDTNGETRPIKNETEEKKDPIIIYFNGKDHYQPIISLSASDHSNNIQNSNNSPSISIRTVNIR